MITLIAGVAAAACCLGAGVFAIAMGWVPPWLRRRVGAARVWGVGMALLGLGLAVERVAFTAWVVLFLAGLGVMWWSQTGRRRRQASGADVS